MKLKKIACCYHPTTIVLIDDDKSYLNSMSLDLGRDMACKTFSNPQEALHFLKDQYEIDPYTNRCIIHNPEDARLRRNIEVDIKPISDEVYNTKRFEQISVVIVDQVMPGLKGLELCENLAGTKFKKILLTGKAEDKDVIEAFNSGVIDKYIPKNTLDLSDSIKEGIKELQEDYFDELSTVVLNSLTEDIKHHPDSCLSDPKFITFFKELLKKHSITEYYLTDTEGSFLLLDIDGKASILVIKDDESMVATYEIANFSDHKPRAEILEKLKNKELILYLHSSEDCQLEPEEWEKHQLLHPAKKLGGTKQTYYYTYIDDSKAYNIELKKIISFNTYLEGLD